MTAVRQAVQFHSGPASIHYRTIVRKSSGGWPAALVPKDILSTEFVWKVWATKESMVRELSQLLPGVELIEDPHSPGCDEDTHCNCPGIHPPAFNKIAPLHAHLELDFEF